LTSARFLATVKETRAPEDGSARAALEVGSGTEVGPPAPALAQRIRIGAGP
jgi:hypothetical protein